MQFLVSVLQFIAVFALVILVFNVIILVHEWGHFVAARWRGLQVDKFQIWFGKPIWKKTINGVQYGLGCIPAGGFVALPQMAPMELLEGKHDAQTGTPLSPISGLDKIIVAFAGPFFSFLLAVVLAIVVWIVGYPASKSANSTVIGGVQFGSGAYRAGLQPGDEVLRVDGKPVTTFSGMVDSITWAVISSHNDDIDFIVRRNGKELPPISVHAPVPKPDASTPWWQRLVRRPDVRRAGIMPKQTPIIVGEVKANSPAEAAGLKQGDVVTGIDGKPLLNYFQIGEHIAETKDAPLQFSVMRGGQALPPVTVRPRIPENPGSLPRSELLPSVGFRSLLEKNRPEQDRDSVTLHVPPHVQIQDTVRTMMNTLGAVFSPKSGVSASHLSGPVGIMHLYYRLFMNADGWKLVLWFSVLLNVNLAVLNLLPFPILDGGHITMAVIEGVFRRTVSLRILEVVNAGCAILLLGFMVYLSGFDAGELFRGKGGNFQDYSFEPPPVPNQQSLPEPGSLRMASPGAIFYCDSLLRRHRRPTREVMAGHVGIGGNHPIRVQSMLTSDTRDTQACIRETLGLVEAGCEIVRITAQTRKYAENLQHIKAGLRAQGCDVPLVADIHFKPDAALEAARWVEKVRINPGNFVDKKKFEIHEYTDEQYEAELRRIEAEFLPLVRLCRERGVAMRIGTNHGSLSDRIMNRYGDTPLGMVESALEFARIARGENFHSFVFSMKASNPKVMIEAYRLLVARLRELGPDWNYPLHLGVTEAGDGEDGRIKSAIGIGSLLLDGIGDTIRVSLTEDSVHEIPVARALIEALAGDARSLPEADIPEFSPSYDPFAFQRRKTEPLEIQGVPTGGPETIRVAVTPAHWLAVCSRLQALGTFQPEFTSDVPEILAVDPLDDASIAEANATGALRLVTVSDHCALSPVPAYRLLASRLTRPHPILLKDTWGSTRDVPQANLLQAAASLGSLLCDGIGDAILVQGERQPDPALRLAYNILQAAGSRIFKTDYVACPSCGRTLFNLQSTTQKIRQATGHLKGVRIAVMGCIVNGPGEMADADFGYVGGAPGKINLYVGKEAVKFNLPEAEAVDRLVDLIREHGRWVDPEPEPFAGVGYLTTALAPNFHPDGCRFPLQRAPFPAFLKSSAYAMQGLLINETTQQTYPLEGSCVVGRSADCSFQVMDPSISRRHAMIRMQGDGFYYFDLGSFNGSFLNGARVTTSRKLAHGDHIAMGDHVFRFEQTGSPDPSAATSLEAVTLAQLRAGDAILLVSDVQGFSALSERLSPDQLAPIIGTWYCQTEQILNAYGATLDKFIGDSVLAYWTDTAPEFRKQAFRAAGALQQATIDTHNVHRDLLTSLNLNFATGTAIHLGRVAYGGMSAQEFTLLGDSVNVAFRLESLTRDTGHNVLTSAEVLKDWPDGRHYCTPLGFRYLKGRQTPIDLWAVTMVPG